MKLSPYSRGGFTLVEIMIVVSIIGLLSAIAIPNYVKARNTSQKDTCLNNLRQLDSALQQWAMENNKDNSSVPVPSALEVYMRPSVLPVCPMGHTPYVFAATLGITPTVSCANAPTYSAHALP